MAVSVLLVFVLVCAIHADDVCDKNNGESIQRADTQNPLSYEPKRTPSYCDRIVIGWPHKKPDASFKVYEYTAITDEYIDYSDHDLVYGYLSYDDMNILAVTFNVGKFVKKKKYKDQSSWDTIVCSLKTSLMESIESSNNEKGKDYPTWTDIDIFFFGFQETKWLFDLDYLHNALRRSFKHGMNKKWGEVIEHYGTGILGARNTYSFILFNKETVFHPKSTFFDKNTLVKKIRLKQSDWTKQLIKTKTAIIIGRFRKKKKNGKSDKFIAFANAHLPVQTDKEDYGVKYREIGMNDVKKEFMRIFNFKNKNNPILFLGDLNFRVINPGKKDEYEQLDKYLNDKGENKKNNGFWYEIIPIWYGDEEKEKRRFLPTCKRREGVWKKQKEKHLLKPKGKQSTISKLKQNTKSLISKLKK